MGGSAGGKGREKATIRMQRMKEEKKSLISQGWQEVNALQRHVFADFYQGKESGSYLIWR